MAIFQYREKRIHYDLHGGLVPEDTLFLHGNLASNNWWLCTIAQLKIRYKQGGHGGGAAFAEWLGCGESSGPQTQLRKDLVDVLVRILGHEEDMQCF